MDGVVVSNHGGRQVDGAIAALDALPEVVDEVAGRSRCCSTPGSAAGPTSSRLVPRRGRGPAGAPVPVGPGAGGRRGRRARAAVLLAEVDLTMALSGAAPWRTCAPSCSPRG